MAEDRVKGQALQQRRLGEGPAVLVPAEDGGQVEPEPVHAVFHHPVAQAVQDEGPHKGMVAVQGVAHAREVVVLSVGREHVVDVVVQALEAEEGTALVALGRVVEHHVQDHVDAVGVQLPDEGLELTALAPGLGRGGRARVGRKEADRVVAPVVEQLAPVDFPAVGHLVELEDGHQLHGVDPQVHQVGDLLHQARKGAGAAHAGAYVLREAAHVQLVDHQVLKRHVPVAEARPVKSVAHHARAVGAGEALGAPDALARDGPGVGVQEAAGLVEEQAAGRVVRPVHPVGVLRVLDVQPEDDHGEGVADAAVLREGEDGIGLRLAPAEEAELAARRVQGLDGEADAAGHGRGAGHAEQARPHGKPRDAARGRGERGGFCCAHFEGGLLSPRRCAAAFPLHLSGFCGA